ncbi:MAG: adenosylcobinamide kinase [Clostridiales bacterium]|nr:adenosylcobinamide kinase [Clostridiales bacterium]
MKLYVGGCCQGQAELAAAETGLRPVDVTPEQAMTAPAIDHFHLLMRRVSDERAFAQALIERNPNAVIVSDEVGMGIVPIDPIDRRWREQVGRALCLLARHAESVTRAVCGIGVRIK